MISDEGKGMSFWEHLESLRKTLMRIGTVVFMLAIVLFIFMGDIFDSVILAPCRGDFPLYQLLHKIADGGTLTPNLSTDFNVELINIKLASQFFIHMSTSCWLAVVLSFPFIIHQLWCFISPGLYPNEKRNAGRAFLWGNVMFFLGAAVGYFLVFPLTLRFLAEYQLSESIPNTITLESYMDNFLILTLVMGLLFELPLLAWLLGRMGLLTRQFFAKYRRHAIVVLLIAAALITPTGDPFTLAVVFFPIYFLWEASATLLPKSSDKE